MTDHLLHLDLFDVVHKHEKEIKDALRFGRPSEEPRDAEQQQIEKERSDSFLDWNKNYQLGFIL